MKQGSPPNITDEDFSYITSEDLERTSRPSYTTVPEDDVLVIKNKGVTYPAHFPAYSIGDGKLRVKDVRDRVAVMMDLSERRMRRVKLLYKGRQLKDPLLPAREYGVKNNSEILVVLPKPSPSGKDDGSIAASESSEEMVVVGDNSSRSSLVGEDDAKTRRRKNRRNKKKEKRGEDDRDSLSSPRDSSSNLGVPGQKEREKPGRRSPSPGKPVSEAMSKLHEISSNFTTKLLPLCIHFTASPPKDPKKRADEHRKLSETVMQQTLLKLDEVETNGDDDARATRKALVKQVQEVLKGLDGVL
jgi:hypothetical protein